MKNNTSEMDKYKINLSITRYIINEFIKNHNVITKKVIFKEQIGNDSGNKYCKIIINPYLILEIEIDTQYEPCIYFLFYRCFKKNSDEKREILLEGSTDFSSRESCYVDYPYYLFAENKGLMLKGALEVYYKMAMNIMLFMKEEEK